MTADRISAPVAPDRLHGHALGAPGEVVVLVQTLHRPFRPHWHDFYEFALVTAGEGFHLLDGDCVKVQPGDALLVAPSGLHAVGPRPGERLELIDVVFDEQSLPEPVRPLLHRLSRVQSTHAGVVHTSTDLSVLFSALARESRAGLFHRELMACGILVQVIVALARRVLGKAEDLGQTSWLPRVLDHIERYYDRPLPVAELASVVHMSPTHFRSRFKQETGRTLTEHLLRVRLRAARGLLALTELPVSRVCVNAGFGNASNFARTFRAATGLSPSAYRRQARAERLTATR